MTIQDAQRALVVARDRCPWCHDDTAGVCAQHGSLWLDASQIWWSVTDHERRAVA
jgi:hypothetical protein